MRAPDCVTLVLAFFISPLALAHLGLQHASQELDTTSSRLKSMFLNRYVVPFGVLWTEKKRSCASCILLFHLVDTSSLVQRLHCVPPVTS